MSDELNHLLQSYSKEIFATIAGLLGSIGLMVRAITKRMVERHDKLEDRVNRLEEEKVDREELNKSVASIRAEMHTMKTEIKSDLREAKEDISSRLEQQNSSINTLLSVIRK